MFISSFQLFPITYMSICSIIHNVPSVLKCMCTEILYKPSAIFKSVIDQNKHYISIIVMNVFTVLPLYSVPRTLISPLSSCLIKTFTAAAGAVIHVLAKDNPVISQRRMQPGTIFYLSIAQMDQFICARTWNASFFHQWKAINSDKQIGDDGYGCRIFFKECFRSLGNYAHPYKADPP